MMTNKHGLLFDIKGDAASLCNYITDSVEHFIGSIF